MLSLFPSLLSWSQISPLLIRLTVGIIFIFWAYKTYRNDSSNSRDKAIAFIEVISGLLLVIGLWTQLASLIIVIDLVIRLYDKFSHKMFLTDGVNYYLILLVMTLSLLFTGAGFLAFDMPL